MSTHDFFTQLGQHRSHAIDFYALLTRAPPAKISSLRLAIREHMQLCRHVKTLCTRALDMCSSKQFSDISDRDECVMSCLAAVGTGGSGGASSMRYGGGAGGGSQGAQGTHHGSGVGLGADLDDNGAGLEGDINDISLEEIRSWGSSFDRLMRNPLGRKLFKEFLVSEYSDENIAFWLACEQLKKEENNDKIEEKARVIYEDYISIISPKEVSLDSRVREIVNRNMTHPTPHTFDEAQLQIYTLMHRDSYPRFVNSELYQRMARINSGPPSPSIEAAADEAATAAVPATAAPAASSSSSTTSTQPPRKSKKSIT